MGELREKTIKGVAWNTVNRFATQIIQFSINIVLARLLLPEDYGAVAMIGVFTVILGIFTDGGLTNALIRKENRTEEDLATVFYYNLAACWIMYAILFVAAPFIADFYDLPIIKPLIRVGSLALLITPAGCIQGVLLTCAINFKVPAIINIINCIISGAVGILLAYSGFGIWSLTYSGLLGVVIGTASRVAVVRWYPKTGFSMNSFKELFGYSSKLLASALLDTGYNQLTPLIVGKFYSPAQLGVYQRGRGWSEMVPMTFTGMIQGVTFPVLSKMQNDTERLAINYRKMLRLSAFIVFPLSVGLASVGRPLTLWILTEKWEASIIFLQIVCFSMMWYPIHAINLNLLQVKGRSDLFLRLEVIKKILGLTVMLSMLPIGLVWFCAAGIVSSMISLVINTYYTGKLINVGYILQMRDLLPILGNCLIMGALSLFVQMFFDDNLLKLIAAIFVGGVYYVGSSYLMHSAELKELISIVRNKGK